MPKKKYPKIDHKKISLIIFTISLIGGCVVLIMMMVSPRLVQLGENYSLIPTRGRSNSFSTMITNKYFKLPIGRKLVYEGRTDEGLERVEITIPGATKKIMGITTLIYRDKVYLDGELVEDTKDYLAQDKDGNVWYFGEDVNNYENGKLVDHEGSWIAGRDGAKPGIWIKANPKVGDSYQQEYYKDVAEDTVDVISVNETVTIGLGKYQNCLKTYDWTPLDSQAKEHKYYCPQLGALVLTKDLVSGDKAELVASTEGINNSNDDDDD